MITNGSQHVLPRNETSYFSPDLGYQMVWDRDVMVPMRDGVQLCIDIYRPDAEQPFPALLAIAPHNKDVQNPDAASQPPQPAWSTMWAGDCEAGDSEYFVSRGYVHIIGNPRGFGKSEDGGDGSQDLYDLIQWIAAQPWCDGNVGMVGLSAFAHQQWLAAMLQPPALKAIFPFDGMPCYGFHDRTPGGLHHTMLYLIGGGSVAHGGHGQPAELSPEKEALWQQAMNNPDYRMYTWAYNILSQKGQIHHRLFEHLLDNSDPEGFHDEVREKLKSIKIPAYTGAGWHAYTYKMHLNGSQNWFEGIDVPKKLLFTGLAHMERPFHSIHDEMLRWYDYWLKGVDTGIMDEPPVNYFVQGANEWRSGAAWPLPETEWTKLYLNSWERLRENDYTANSRDSGYEVPDAFVQMPPTHTRAISGLRYMTDPLPNDTLVAGPMALNFFAEIDQDDTNWIIIIKDMGPDPYAKTGRFGEMEQKDIPEREISRGWLKASRRETDDTRSKPWKPWHKMTRSSIKPVIPGEITEYNVEICATANLFKRGHRISVEITSMDMPNGSGYGHSTEYVPYHLCSSRTTVHKVYHNARYPSHLILPVIPQEGGAK